MRTHSTPWCRTAVSALVLFAFATVSFAQAPGWSRGQQDLQVSYDECRRRAPIALEAEGYRIDYNAGAFSVGIKGVHTAVISCHPAPASVVAVNIVVASNGEGGGEERQRLQAQMEHPGSVPGRTPGKGSGGGCGLGTHWTEHEEGWTATWTRRGDSNVFDVQSAKGSLSLTARQTISIDGNRVAVVRTNSSDGNDCEMRGTIASDGISVTGTYNCKSGGPYNWNATIHCSASGSNAQGRMLAVRVTQDHAAIVDWSNGTTDKGSWVSVVPVNTDDGAHVGKWTYTQGAGSGKYDSGPLTAGDYEARFYGDSGYAKIVDRVRFSVSPFEGSAGRMLSVHVTGDRRALVDWSNGTSDTGSWVSVVPTGTADSTHTGKWVYTQGKASGRYDSGPLPPGEYEARFYGDDRYGKLLERTRFTVP